MRILVRIVGSPRVPFPLPDGWPVPRVGDGWSSPECPSGTVGSVTHYPSGEFEGYRNSAEIIGEPMVYVVVHSDTLR